MIFQKVITFLHARNYASATVASPSLTVLLYRLQLSIDHQSSSLAFQLHAQAIALGHAQDPRLATKLISAYSKCNNIFNAKRVFDSVSRKNVIPWNSLINGYMRNDLKGEGIELFKSMYRVPVSPDEFTFSIVAKACGEFGDEELGKALHAKSITNGLLLDTVLANSMILVYSKCGKPNEALKVFDEMSHRNVGSWNVIISGFVASRDENAWIFAQNMQTAGVSLDGITISSLLQLCGGEMRSWDYGKELHCYVIKRRLDLALGSNIHLGCSLIDMYSKTYRVNFARFVFEDMESRNVYAWTAMINGFVQNGKPDEAFGLLHLMQMKGGISPNKVTLLCILPACSSFAGLLEGKQIHGFAIRREFNTEVSLSNALLDMYSKCGSLDSARKIFDGNSFCRDVISWSSIISGYGSHGKGQEAVHLYHQMLRLGIKPDTITVVGVLSACGMSGLVSEGLAIYNSMIKDYDVKPAVEIYACMVDMLGRYGRLDEALDFVKMMPVEPGPSVWGALVSASIAHENAEMRDWAYKFLVQLEPENPSNFIALSNLYASCRRWDAVANVRTTMKDRGLRKLPGCSWISINNTTHSFFVSDEVHPCAGLIYEILGELVWVMKDVDYSLDLEISNV